MPDEQNSMRKESLSGLGIPYENIHPPLKTLRITDEERAKFPAYYDIPDVPEYAKSYKEQYLQDTI
ncbi:MAG: hypothetical protein LBU27_04310 [Candidatus Peribacteria bacterium]|jgi:hypothetical protein|nr:hypothetical protein [Candidatus Peribacteria bacterium]